MKNYIIEIDVNRHFPTIINHSAGLYKVCVKPAVQEILYGEYGKAAYKCDNIRSLTVGSIIVDGQDYFKVPNETECYNQEHSFVYDYDTQTIIMHFTNYEPPFGRKLYIGITEYYTQNLKAEDRIALEAAQPLITRMPKTKQKKDLLYFDILKYQKATFKMNNAEGAFDDYGEEQLYNSECRLKHGKTTDEHGAYELLYVGNIESYEVDNEELTVSITDTRSLLDFPICRNKIFKSEYPYLKNPAEYKPVIYGSVKGAKTICLQEEEEGRATYSFFVADTSIHGITSIAKVYADTQEVPLANVDQTELSAGIIKLSAADCTNSGGNIKMVTCDVRGANMSNSIDILQDILVNYAEILYSDTFFDTIEWNIARGRSFDIAVYENSGRQIKNVIKDICVSNKGVFMRKTDGRYTFRISDYTKPPVFTIHPDMMMRDPSMKKDGASFLSECVVKYNKNHGNGYFEEYRDDSRVLQIKQRYRAYKLKEFETLLVNSSDAQILATAYLDEYSNPPQLYTVTIPLYDNNNDTMYLADLFDMILMYYDRKRGKLGLFEVTETECDTTKNQIKLVMQYIQEA